MGDERVVLYRLSGVWGGAVRFGMGVVRRMVRGGEVESSQSDGTVGVREEML